MQPNHVTCRIVEIVSNILVYNTIGIRIFDIVEKNLCYYNLITPIIMSIFQIGGQVIMFKTSGQKVQKHVDIVQAVVQN